MTERAAVSASRVPCPAAARAPAASCLPPAALLSPPPALCAPAPTEPPSRAPPLGVAVAAVAAAAAAAENEAASRSPGPALGHLIRRAGAPARPDRELRLRGPRPPCFAAAAATQNPVPAPTWPGPPTAPVRGLVVLNRDRGGSRFYAQPHFALRSSPSSPQKLLFSTTFLKNSADARGRGGGGCELQESFAFEWAGGSKLFFLPLLDRRYPLNTAAVVLHVASIPSPILHKPSLLPRVNEVSDRGGRK